jgi:tetratricopeptide (TPR) repeat protein
MSFLNLTPAPLPRRQGNVNYLRLPDRQSGAIVTCVEAIRLEPDTEGIRPSYALWLTAKGRFPAALEQIDFSLGKRPYEVGWLAIRASILYSARRYEEAIATADRALTIDDRARGPWEWRSKSLFQVGRGAEAVKALAQEAFAQHSAALDAAVHDGGGAGGLRALLNVTGDWRLRNEQSWRRIAWRALLDDDEGALDELDQAYALRNVNLMYAAVDPAYDRIRGHSRFQRVLSQMGLGANEYYEK